MSDVSSTVATAINKSKVTSFTHWQATCCQKKPLRQVALKSIQAQKRVGGQIQAAQPPQATNKVERLNLLRCYVQRLCEDAGQLGMPQAREEFAEVKLKHAQMLCVCVHVNRVYT